MLIWINGAFGSGKTLIAHELQRRLQDALVTDPETASRLDRARLGSGAAPGHLSNQHSRAIDRFYRRDVVSAGLTWRYVSSPL
jgi:hypothetical protein